ncbi:hypothetical protein [Myxococcus eversor]|uniref:hypothetical protein n=1 Tax=Myxococcus eversor TaxID=2709661 RepID=UPI0013D7332B|nr:hypothetical protein [Myxococcus eversor]
MKIFTIRNLLMRLLVLSLLCLAPGLALAATDDPPRGEAAPPVTEPSKLLPVTDPPSESPMREVLHTSARIAAEIGAMSVTGLAMGFPGLIVAGAASRPPQGIGGGIDEAVSGYFLGAAVGVPIGTMWGAHLLGGKGTWTGTLIGAGSAAGTGAVTALLLANEGDRLVIASTAALAGSILGSFIGYEVSHASNSAPPAPSEVSVLPSVAVSQGGMMLGLGGRF